ncbi:hypothetical protein GALMADRAFT_161831 [Galerina marginata CBS 339.88]|uniref:F-box domain-containing protein n=1 Tax=Galerina marginata (strain CBS 339.88) TaxID=685588 RepID=A0A067S7N3_GALM3|nr:hypothetical protein GALMADRAFT_161831 [Galerina marginata CBS 339.88]
MPPIPTLPLEIVQEVVDILAQDGPDLSSIKACSVTCKTYLPLCRKHIFSSILLTGQIRPIHVSKPTLAAFIRVLSTTPEIAYYIRNLVYYPSMKDLDLPLLPETFMQIQNLESLSIHWPVRSQFQWNKNPLRLALLHLLHLPTLIRLEARGIRDFVIVDLMPCTNLKEFKFSRINFAKTENIFPSPLPSRPIRLRQLSAGEGSSAMVSKLYQTLRPDGKPILDFTSIASVSLMVEEDDELNASQEFLKRCRKLTHVQKFLDSSPLTWAGLSRVLHPSLQTLAHLHLKTMITDPSGTNDPLSGLVTELQEMRHQNCIEKITIQVSIQSGSDCNRGDDWGRLDEELARPGWLKLKSVLLSITFCMRKNSDLEIALRKLPETQFPRLSSSTSVLFDFSVINTAVLQGRFSS